MSDKPEDERPVSCGGARSRIKPWMPHGKCRTCALYRVIGSPVAKPALEQVGDKAECINWRAD